MIIVIIIFKVDGFDEFWKMLVVDLFLEVLL